MAKSNLEIKIGVFVTVGIVLLMAMIIMFGEFRFFHNTYTVTCYFKESISGITPGVDVTMLGKRIGEAASFEITPEPQVKAVLKIDKQYRIPKDSTVRKVQQSFLGDYYLSIKPPDGTIKEMIPTDDSAVLETVVDTSLGDLAPKVDQFLKDYEPQIAELMKNLNSAVASLNQIVSDPASQKYLKDALRDASATVAKGPGIADEVAAVVKESHILVQNLNKTTATFDAQVSALGKDYQKVAKDINSVAEKLDAILSSMKKISDKATSESTVGKLVSDTELYAKMVETLDQAKATLSQIKRTMQYFEEHPSDLVWGSRKKMKEPETQPWWEKLFAKEKEEDKPHHPEKESLEKESK
ncbi:MAG: MlaD family protein [Planctomycetota bacterium]